jgi:hypothetical protein
MRTHRNPRPGMNINGIRLLAQELSLVRKGMLRYSSRARALAGDLEMKTESRRIEKMNSGVLEVLAELEGKLGSGVADDLQ